VLTCTAMFTNGRQIWVLQPAGLSSHVQQFYLQTSCPAHPFFFSGPSFAHFGPPTGKSALGQHMLFRAGTCSHTKTWFFHLPWPWPRGRRTGLLPICSPSPSYLQIYIHPTSASVVKKGKHISHTGELPGPANSYSTIFVFLLLASSVVFCSSSI
jgi:hypothetical protein